jgi:hypothetical protein
MRPGAESERRDSWLLRQLQRRRGSRCHTGTVTCHDRQSRITLFHPRCPSSTQVRWGIVSREFLLSRWEIVTRYLPQDEGLLPKWQLVVAVMAFFNAAQNFVTLKLTRRIYGNVAPPLGSETRPTRLVTSFANEGSFASSNGAAGEDFRRLDGPLRRCAPLRSLQHQPQSVRARSPPHHQGCC